METLEELKSRQKEGYMIDIRLWSRKVKFSAMSAGFFALYALIMAFNPCFSIWFVIGSLIIMAGFAISAIHRNSYLKMYRKNYTILSNAHNILDNIVEDYLNSDEYKNSTEYKVDEEKVKRANRK